MRNVFNRIWPTLRLRKGRFSLALFVTLIGISLILVWPQVVRIAIDGGLQGGDDRRFYQAMILLAGILILQIPAVFLKTVLFEDIARKVGIDLLDRLHRRLLQQEIGFFDSESAGELNTRLTRDIWDLIGLIGGWVPGGLRAAMGGFFGLGLMFYTSPLLSSLVVAVGPPVGWLTARLGSRIQRRQSTAAQANAIAASASLESLTGVRTVRSFDQEEAESRRFVSSLRAFDEASAHRTKSSAILESLSTFFTESAVALGLGAGGVMIMQGGLTIGELVSFMLYSGLVMQSFKQLSSLGGEVMRADGATERVFELMAREPLLPAGGGLIPSTSIGEVKFENVHFHYPSRPDVGVLKGLDLTIAPGEFLAIVGPSGMGKSTLGQLMVRFYDPEQGRVLFDGHDLRALDAEWLRKQVVLVPQDSSLFSRSIDENVRYGSDDASDADVDRALRATGAMEFVDRQPLGLETEVGDRGTTFSGGQRQRIAIARALLRKPRVLILDEATSALDAPGEAFVKESLKKLPDRPTIVMIAHRLSTIVDADRVVVIEAGRITDCGRHDELIKQSDHYRELIKTQLVGDSFGPPKPLA
jgi:ABC-type multidrug transport system fused ATPase/permease subunit